MINYGIIGTGGIAKIHAEIIKDLPNAYLFGAHDIVEDNLENLIRLHLKIFILC